MNARAFLQGYLYKEATGSTGSFSASVGNATKKFMNGTQGTSSGGRASNLPKSKFIPKYEEISDVLERSEVGHPVRADGDTLKERYKKDSTS